MKRILLLEKKVGDVEIQLENRAQSTAQLMTEVDVLGLVGHKPWQVKTEP